MTFSLNRNGTSLGCKSYCQLDMKLSPVLKRLLLHVIIIGALIYLLFFNHQAPYFCIYVLLFIYLKKMQFKMASLLTS